MMAGYEPCFCSDTCWKKKKKRHSLAIEEMQDRPIEGGQKLRKKRGLKREWIMLVGKKKDFREILPHLPWVDYELCLVVKDA